MWNYILKKSPIIKEYEGFIYPMIVSFAIIYLLAKLWGVETGENVPFLGIIGASVVLGGSFITFQHYKHKTIE